MATRLKLVATPLGNINDISLRAIEAIKDADAIFAEDTRHSLKLITALNVSLKDGCRLISCDAHKEEKRIPVIIEKLQANENVLLLSDAGCPTISDPGSLLVQGIINAGCAVEIIPGPSAHCAALMGAGIDTTRFAFLGFLPQKNQARKQLITQVAETGLALVIYEAPQRLDKLLDELFGLLGARRVVVARELTKIFETFHRGQLGAPLTPPFVQKGELVVIVEASKKDNRSVKDIEEDLHLFITQEIAKGTSAKDVTRLASSKFSLKKKVVYELVINLLNNA